MNRELPESFKKNMANIKEVFGKDRKRQASYRDEAVARILTEHPTWTKKQIWNEIHAKDSPILQRMTYKQVLKSVKKIQNQRFRGIGLMIDQERDPRTEINKALWRHEDAISDYNSMMNRIKGRLEGFPYNVELIALYTKLDAHRLKHYAALAKIYGLTTERVLITREDGQGMADNDILREARRRLKSIETTAEVENEQE